MPLPCDPALNVESIDAGARLRDAARAAADAIEREHSDKAHAARVYRELMARGFDGRTARELSRGDGGTPRADDDIAAGFPTLDATGADTADVEPLALMLAWPGNVAAIHGRAGCGKSRILADAAASVSRGEQWLDTGNAIAPRRVVWLAFEDRTGARQLLRQHGADGALVHVGDGALLLADWPARLERLLDAISPDWVIVDSFASLAAASGMDSNNADEVTTMLRPFASAAESRGLAVTITHHQPHNENRLRNSSGIAAAVDAVLGVEVNKDARVTYISTGGVGGKMRFALKHHRRIAARLSDDGRRFTLSDGRVPSTIGGSAGKTQADSNDAADRESIRGWLASHPGASNRQVIKAITAGAVPVLGGCRTQRLNRLIGLAKQAFPDGSPIGAGNAETVGVSGVSGQQETGVSAFPDTKGETFPGNASVETLPAADGPSEPTKPAGEAQCLHWRCADTPAPGCDGYCAVCHRRRKRSA